MAKRSKKHRRAAREKAQFEFEFQANGGARRGSGRKREGPRALVPHRPRGRMPPSAPILITIRLLPRLPSLRRLDELDVVRTALQAGSAQPDFQVVHYSVQSNHLHLIVEASHRVALATRMNPRHCSTIP